MAGCRRSSATIVPDTGRLVKCWTTVLDENVEILEAVHRDLQGLSRGDRRGRRGDFTAENILRALVVQHLEGLPFRETVIRIGGDHFRQDFLRMRKKAVMDYSFLDKCFLAIRPQTGRQINHSLARCAVREGVVDPAVIRTDTTVVETNIHYPTDASLLWDTWRVASRRLKRAREIAPESVPYRFHDGKIKGLYPYVTRCMPGKSPRRKRKVKAAFRALIERTGRIVTMAEEFRDRAATQSDFALAGLGLELKAHLPAMNTVVRNARRAQVDRETVPARQRVFSLFERHTELIRRGRREKPVEFGHKLLLCQTAEKFISDYEVYPKQQADCALTASVIERHAQLYGARPEVLAADKGFCPAAEKFQSLRELLGTLAIPRRMQDFVDKVLAAWQALRAGIEGTISGLKRAFRLVRCFFRGFSSFSAAVGLGVFCHNLIVVAEQHSG